MTIPKIGDFIKVTKSEQFSEFNKPNNEIMRVIDIKYNSKYGGHEYTEVIAKRKSDPPRFCIGFMIDLSTIEIIGTVTDILNREI